MDNRDSSRPAITPVQKRRNRIVGLILAVVVLSIFGYTIFRGSALFADVGTY